MTLQEESLTSIAHILRGILHAMMLKWDMAFDADGDVVFAKKDEEY